MPDAVDAGRELDAQRETELLRSYLMAMRAAPFHTPGESWCARCDIEEKVDRYIGDAGGATQCSYAPESLDYVQ